MFRLSAGKLESYREAPRHDQPAIGRTMDVELDRVGAELVGESERGEAVLWLARRCAAVRDRERCHAVSGWSCFLGAIQSFSRISARSPW